ncbi:unnamed protein product [Phyllotreta striolata]|uniref:Uncharacterized protein n=1 Tax=Phyllotreta striolata TaxID=444603 RepID=A0A9N9U122_PHYSR|nr:unnamed protein product [Phyllotreta striolata]
MDRIANANNKPTLKGGDSLEEVAETNSFLAEDISKSLDKVSIKQEKCTRDPPQSKPANPSCDPPKENGENENEILESISQDRPPKFANITNTEKFRKADQKLKAKMLYNYHTYLAERRRKSTKNSYNLAPLPRPIPIPLGDPEDKSNSDSDQPRDIYTSKSGRQTVRKQYTDLSVTGEGDSEEEWSRKSTRQCKNKTPSKPDKEKVNEVAASSSNTPKSKALSNKEIISKSSLFSDESLVTKRSPFKKKQEAPAVKSTNEVPESTTTNDKRWLSRSNSNIPNKRLRTGNSKDAGNEVAPSQRQKKKLDEINCPICNNCFSTDEIQEHASTCGE